MSDEFGLSRTLDLQALEEELRRLPDVNAARVVVDAGGRPVEVHVVATTEKHPKQVVRDVLSVAQASFGLDLDRRVVSVVRLEDEGASSSGPRRIVLHSVGAEQRAGHRAALGRGPRRRHRPTPGAGLRGFGDGGLPRRLPARGGPEG